MRIPGSVLLAGSRIAFLVYFVVIFGSHATPHTNLLVERIPLVWCLYLFFMYLAFERIYAVFKTRGIDLAYAFPLLFAVFILNGVSLLVRGQEHVPVINRAEHFTSFVMIGYVVWTFFLKYLPHEVWHDHPYYTALLALSVTSLIGVGNEIVELGMDSLLGTHTIGPRFDTNLDLLMNTLGSGIFLAVTLILREGNISFSGSSSDHS